MTLFAAAILLVGVPFGLLLDQVVQSGPLIEVDTAAANHLHNYVRRSPLLVDVLRVISFIGSPPWFYALVTVAVVYLFRTQRIRLAVFLSVTTIAGGLINSVVKILVGRPRPSLEEPVATAFGNSFPSGHAMASLVVYGALVLVFLPWVPPRRRAVVAGLATVLVLAIGFSRLALGVHYISDVLGGYALGLAWLLACAAAFSIWREERGRPPVAPLGGLEPEESNN